METVYVLLEKFLEDDFTRVLGVFATRELAEEVMEEQMTIWEEYRAYRVTEIAVQGR